MDKDKQNFLVLGELFSEKQLICTFQNKIGDRELKALKFVEPGNMLDVGCGTGTFVNLMKKKFSTSNVIGIDYCENHIKAAKFLYPHIKNSLKKNDLYNLNFQKESIDSITCLDVLEHIKDVDFILKKINKILKFNGCLIIAIPNPYCYKELFKFFFKEVKRNISKKNLKKHIVLKSAASHIRFKPKWVTHLYSWTPSTVYNLTVLI